jgi:hypothetical protein
VIVIVTGRRTAEGDADKHMIWTTLNAVHNLTPITELRHGACRGVDRIAEAWALARGVYAVPNVAEWSKWGPSAGPRRNRIMLTDEPRPRKVIAFRGGRGTVDCKRQSRALGIEVMEVDA